MKKMSVWLFIAVFLAVAGSNVVGQESTAAGRGLEVEANIEVFPQLGYATLISGLNSIAFNSDGTRIVSDAENVIKIWDVTSSRELFYLQGHSSTVNSVVFSPDGEKVVSGSSDGTIKIWDSTTGRELRSLRGNAGQVQSVAFSPDGSRIVSGFGEKIIKIWDVTSGEEICSLHGHTSLVTSVVFSPDSEKIVSGSWDDTVKIWDVATGQLIRTISGHSDNVVSVVFSPDGKKVVSGSNDGTIKIWDVATGRLILTLSGHNGSKNVAAFSPDGRTIVSGGRTLKLWDATSGNELRSLLGHSAGVTSVAFSLDGKTIVSGSGDKTVKIWEAATGREMLSLQGYSDRINFAAFGHNGTRIVSGNNKTVKIWDATTGRELHSLSKGIVSAVFSPDGKTIVSSGDGTLKLWDVATGSERRSWRDPSMPMQVAVSSDGTRIVSGGNNTVKVWDAATGKELLSWQEDAKFGVHVVLSPDGTRIVSRLSNPSHTMILRDATTGRQLRSWQGESFISPAFSPDGTRIVVGSNNGTVKVWNAITGEEMLSLKNINTMVDSVVFSPDGAWIVAGSRDNAVKIWDVATGRLIRTLSGHSGWVTSVAFSPDGKTIVSSSLDGTVRLWNAATGKELARLISFSGTDTQIASATRGLTVETEAAATAIDGEWLAMTPEGYYQASPQGDRYINVRVGNTVSGIDAYRSVLYNPDVVQARLRGLPDPASKSAVTIQQAASFAPPAVTIRSPAGNTTTGSSTTTLSVAITDLNQPIQNIKIMVNGRILGRQELSAVTRTSGLQPQKASFTVTGNRKTVEFQLPLSLDPGPNRIEVVAFNGFSESRRYTDIVWNAPAGQRIALPNLWILAVGVNGYADSNIRNLNYCVADAKSVVDSLKAQEGKRYGRVNSLLIADGEGLSPTAANIRQNLSFLEGAGPRDVALLFLAGHGVSGSAGAFFFLPADTRLNADGTVNPATAITGAELFAALDAPGNRLVFIDACQSGGVDNDRLVRYLMDTNAFVFASSRGNELSQERPEFGHGVFTYSILNAIKGATAARAEGNVSVLSLSGFVSTDVPRITDDRQHPSAYSLGFYDFPLAAVP